MEEIYLILNSIASVCTIVYVIYSLRQEVLGVLRSRPIALVFVGFFLGLLTRTVRPFLHVGLVHYEILIALIVLICLIGRLALFHRHRGAQALFQLENGSVWIGWVVGWSLVHQAIWDDLLVVAIPWWLGCGVVGGFVVSLRRRLVA